MLSSSGSEKCEKHSLIDGEDSGNNVDCCYVFNCILKMKVVASGSRAQNARSGIIKKFGLIWLGSICVFILPHWQNVVLDNLNCSILQMCVYRTFNKVLFVASVIHLFSDSDILI
jgi:hypothetical protein